MLTQYVPVEEYFFVLFLIFDVFVYLLSLFFNVQMRLRLAVLSKLVFTLNCLQEESLKQLLLRLNYRFLT